MISLRKPINIVYEDDYLLAVDKPAQMLVFALHPGEKNNLYFLLNRQLQERGLTVNAHPCHRLDKETSGLVIFSKGKKIQQAIMEQFRARTVKKTYLAFVQGYLKQTKGELKSYIANAWPYNHKEEKKLAVTRFELIAKGDGFSVIKFEPLTGRTNQIRIQCRDIGHPLVGERRFSFARDWTVKFKRAALHAWTIKLIHPANKKTLLLKAQIPRDMMEFLQKYNLPCAVIA